MERCTAHLRDSLSAEFILVGLVHPIVIGKTTSAEGLAEDLAKQFFGIDLRSIGFITGLIWLSWIATSACVLAGLLTGTKRITAHSVGIVVLPLAFVAQYLKDANGCVPIAGKCLLHKLRTLPEIFSPLRHLSSRWCPDGIVWLAKSRTIHPMLRDRQRVNKLCSKLS